MSAILEVNPDIKEGETLQAGDCIEIPVKHILPRLYVVKASDSMASIARYEPCVVDFGLVFV